MGHKQYCKSGNIRDVLIFANFARRRNSEIEESRENYYYNIATEDKWKFANSNFVKKLPDLQIAVWQGN